MEEIEDNRIRRVHLITEWYFGGPVDLVPWDLDFEMEEYTAMNREPN